MLQGIIDRLCLNRVVLASQSPRRKELLQLIGFKNIEIIPSTFEENLRPEDFPTLAEFVEQTALLKVLEVDERLRKQDEKPPALICGADTIVTLNGEVFGKPKSNQDAFNTLSRLSNNTNTVYTSVVLKFDQKIVKFTESTHVKIANLSKERIEEYISTGEPMDKAGGYGIQGYGSTIVERIDGDVYTVVGFPVCKFTKILLEDFGHSQLDLQPI